MLPTAHLLVALVPVLAFVYLRDRRLPSPGVVAVGAFGSQFPDLVDKPLAHALYVIPSGRVFMHSLPFAVPVWLLVGAYAWWTGRTRAGAVFAFAHASHIVADNAQALFGPDPRVPADMLWPLVPATSRPPIPHWAGAGLLNVHLWALFSALVLAAAGFLLGVDVREQLRRRGKRSG